MDGGYQFQCPRNIRELGPKFLCIDFQGAAIQWFRLEICSAIAVEIGKIADSIGSCDVLLADGFLAHCDRPLKYGLGPIESTHAAINRAQNTKMCCRVGVFRPKDS